MTLTQLSHTHSFTYSHAHSLSSHSLQRSLYGIYELLLSGSSAPQQHFASPDGYFSLTALSESVQGTVREQVKKVLDLVTPDAEVTKEKEREEAMARQQEEEALSSFLLSPVRLHSP